MAWSIVNSGFALADEKPPAATPSVSEPAGGWSDSSYWVTGAGDYQGGQATIAPGAIAVNESTSIADMHEISITNYINKLVANPVDVKLYNPTYALCIGRGTDASKLDTRDPGDNSYPRLAVYSVVYEPDGVYPSGWIKGYRILQFIPKSQETMGLTLRTESIDGQWRSYVNGTELMEARLTMQAPTAKSIRFEFNKRSVVNPVESITIHSNCEAKKMVGGSYEWTGFSNCSPRTESNPTSRYSLLVSTDSVTGILPEHFTR
jgi:hypothetical protein